MTWHLTEDPAVFRASVRDYLAADPAGHTLLLTQLDAPGTRGWWPDPLDGRVAGAFLLAPSGFLLLGTMPDPAVRELAASPYLPEATGVRGESATAEAFADARARTPVRTRRMRLYRLGGLTPPHPAPAGRARPAAPGDVPLVVGWMREYARDIGEDPDADYTANVEARVADARLHLWEAAGRPVAMASVSRAVEGQARVSLVYTPPAHRARGYGGAVTCAVSRAAVDAGAGQVLLFADLANPVSNALYQRLGYRPIGDHTAFEFG